MELTTMSVHALSERVENLEQQLGVANAELQRVRSALTWQSVKNGDYWPREGEIYLVKINGVLQHEAYRFETEDSDFGTGKNYWFREDCDECPLFSPESDEWLPLSALKALASPAAEPDIHCDTLSELRKLGGVLGIAMPESLEMMRPGLVKQIIRRTTQLFEQQPAPATEPARSLNWISVHDRLPKWWEDESKVLVYSATHDWGGQQMLIVDPVTLYEDADGWTDVDMHYVTHWMPLPNKPAPVAQSDGEIQLKFFRDLTLDARTRVFIALGALPESFNKSLTLHMERMLLRRLLKSGKQSEVLAIVEQHKAQSQEGEQ